MQTVVGHGKMDAPSMATICRQRNEDKEGKVGFGLEHYRSLRTVERTGSLLAAAFRTDCRA